MTGIIFHRLMIMLFYMLPGFLLYKGKIITDTGAKELGKLLLYVILPATIVNSYNIGFSKEKAIGLLISLMLAIVVLGLSIVLSSAFFGKKNPIECFGAAFSNAGFMGIPLVSAVLGSEAVYYAAAFVAILNILQWTYGVYCIAGNKNAVSWKKIIGNPVLLSFFGGSLLFFAPIQLPDFLSEILVTVSGMNAPIAMLIIGMYLAQVSVRQLFFEAISYKVSLVRLLIIPAATACLLACIPLGDTNLKQAMLILAAAPIGSNVAVYAQIYGCDYKQAVKEVVLSTLLSIISMPLLIGIADYML